MTLFPVVERELRVSSRRSWTYWGRSVSGLLALLITGWILALQSIVQVRTTGQALFSSISVLALLVSSMAGVTYTSDCISSEKREGTLGLLFLTDLKGFDVALGKLTATSLGAFYGLLALLPVMSMGLLLGGVTGGEYLRMVLVLISTLLLSLSIGLAVSVVSRDALRSAMSSFVLILAVFFLMPVGGMLLGDLLDYWAKSDNRIRNSLEHSIGWMTPLFAYSQVADAEFKKNPSLFWKAEAWIGGLALVVLVFASLRLPRSWQDKRTGTANGGWRAWLDALRFSSVESRLQTRRTWLDHNPGAWLSTRYWLRSASVWAMLFLLVLGFAYGGWRAGSGWWNTGIYLASSILLHLILKVWIANEAPRQFIEDRRTGALELLLTTAFDVPELLAGRRIALMRQFGAPIAIALLFDAIFLISSLRVEISGSDEQLMWTFLWLLRMLFLPLDAVTLFWLGMWKGMTGTGSRAASGVVGLGLALPVVATLILYTFLGMASVAGQTSWVTPMLLLCIWAVICGLNSFIWISRSRRIVVNQFRELAHHRPDGRASWWSRLWKRSKAGSVA